MYLKLNELLYQLILAQKQSTEYYSREKYNTVNCIRTIIPRPTFLSTSIRPFYRNINSIVVNGERAAK